MRNRPDKLRRWAECSIARSYRNVLLSFGKKKVSKENLFGAHFRSRVLTRERSERRTLFFCLLFFSREKKSKAESPELYPGLSCVSATGNAVADTAGRGLRGRRCGPVHEGVRNSQDASPRYLLEDVNFLTDNLKPRDLSRGDSHFLKSPRFKSGAKIYM